jgi:Tol biopolymer transport system component
MTDAPGEDETPVWIPARKELIYAGDSPGGTRVVKTTMAGISGVDVLLHPSGNHRHTDSVSPDGRLLAFTDFSRETGEDIWIMPLEGDHKPQAFLQTSFNESEARFSPDGRWIAYVSNESGRNEIYLQSYPDHAGKLQISSDGGDEPVWAHDGRELFYRNTSKMMVAEIINQPAFKAGKPRLLFEGRYENLSWEPNYDVSPDGQKFLMLKSLDDTPPNQINIVLNWYEELRHRAGSAAGKTR